jgi:hypothetical protein
MLLVKFQKLLLVSYFKNIIHTRSTMLINTTTNKNLLVFIDTAWDMTLFLKTRIICWNTITLKIFRFCQKTQRFYFVLILSSISGPSIIIIKLNAVKLKT